MMFLQKIYFSLLIYCLLNNFVNCSIKQGDKLVEDLQISDVKETFVNGQGFLFTQIVEFPNEKFAHILIKGDENLYIFMTQNGQAISSLIGPLNDVTTYSVLTSNGCRFNEDKLMVTFSQRQGGASLQILQIVDINTQQKVGNNIDFSLYPVNADNWMSKCAQIDDQYIGLGWHIYASGYFYRNFNILTNSLSTPQGMNETNFNSFIGYMAALKDSTNVVTTWCQHVPGNLQQYYFQLAQKDGTKIGSNVLIENSTFQRGYYYNPIVSSTDAGGFVIVFYDSETGDTFMGSYTSDGTQICNKKIASLKRWPKVIAYKDKAYISYSEWDSDTIDYLIGKVAYLAIADLTSCELDDQQEIMSADIFYHVHLSIATGEQATILGVQYIAMENSKRQLKYTEYFLDAPYLNNDQNNGGSVDQGGNVDNGSEISQPQTLCNNKNCFGCYGQNLDSCPMCIGSSTEKREERKTLSGGTCECPISTHFENSDFDCELCSNLGITYRDNEGICKACLPACASCSDGSSCDTCINAQNIPELKCQNCPQIYYVNQEGICKQCPDNCKSCSNSNSCDECPQSHQNKDLLCTCPEIYYLDNYGICQECNSACLQCSNSTTCDTCKNDQMYPETLCSVSIIGNFIIIQNNHIQVQQCMDKCNTCNNISECQSCKDVTKNINFNCECPEIYYYDDNGICQECSQECESCSSKNTCDTCKKNYIKKEDICICPIDFIEVQGLCLEQCKDKYFLNYNTLKCEKCQYYQDICLDECPENTILDTSNYICEKSNQNDITLILIFLAVGFIIVMAGIIFNCKTVKFSKLTVQNPQLKQNGIKKAESNSSDSDKIQNIENNQQNQDIEDKNIENKQQINSVLQNSLQDIVEVSNNDLLRKSSLKSDQSQNKQKFNLQNDNKAQLSDNQYSSFNDIQNLVNNNYIQQKSKVSSRRRKTKKLTQNQNQQNN